MTKEIEVAVEAAKAAGGVLRNGFGRQHSVEYKGEVDLVTEADKRAEQEIVGRLRDAFPAYGILTEEGGGSSGEANSRWIIDPLDGTTNYTHDFPIFATSIALQREGEVVLGVVYDPMADETYVAERGSGAMLDGEPIKVSDTDELIVALLATGFPYDRDEVLDALDLFGQFVMLTQSIRRLGSAARLPCAMSLWVD